MTSTTKRQIADLFGYLIKDAERHGMTTATISVARCKTILADMKADKPQTINTPAFFSRLDRIHAL